MTRHAKKIALFFFVFLTAGAAHAAFPKPVGYVNDFARVLNPAVSGQLENLLKSFEQKTSNEIVVVTLPLLDGRTIEDTAVDLYKEWGIGKRGRDNGALFLVAPSERKMRIEVGYGLEGVINDALAGRILDKNVVPHFKSGDISGGITAGTIALVKTIAAKEGISFDVGAALENYATPDGQTKRTPLSIALKILFFLLMAYLFIRHPWLFLLFFMSGGRGGGGFSGGFGGFGGGLSGGGGASRSW